MHIALLAPVWTSIPPRGYGGVEMVLAALADGLVDAGHDVTLFATGDSETKATLVATLSEPPTRPGRRTAGEVEHALACFLRADEFDVISSHLGPLGGALSFYSRTPVVHTVSDPIDRTRELWGKVARFNPALLLVSVSARQQELAPELPWLSACHNGLPLERYRFRSEPGDYLAFVGRMSPDKGCAEAISVARRSKLPLRIAAKIHEDHEQAYFAKHVRPSLGDGIEYLGEVTHDEKVELLGGALATLFPIAAEEAFGLVAAESMACGTPVVALRGGAIEEVVAHGVTGFIADDEQGMVTGVDAVRAIDRTACRGRVEQLFSAERLVRSYEIAYELAVRRDVRTRRRIVS